MASTIGSSRLLRYAIPLAGLVVVVVVAGVVIYRSQPEADSSRNGAGAASVSGAMADGSRTQAVDGVSSAQGSSDSLMEVTRRVRKIEEQIAHIGEILAKISVSEGPRRSFPVDAVPDNSPERFAELVERADLDARFSAEAGTSRWGTTAAAAIDEAYSAASTESPFFSEYGGAVSTDCRESVCSVSWSPSGSAAQLSIEEKADLLAQAKWELMSLAGAAREAGQVRVVTNPASDPPTIRLMIDHASDGDVEMPDKVSGYLGFKGEDLGR